MTANQVLTIHDLAPLDHPEWFNPGFAAWYRFLLPRLARRVRRIIAVSAFTCRRIVKRLDIPKAKLSVIPSGVDVSYFHPASHTDIQEIRQEYALERPFLLFVGTLQPRKNLNRLLKAWVRCPEADLVLIGSTSYQFRNAGISSLPLNVRTLGRVDDSKLPAFYSAAMGVVIPSLYEGSCLVGLEALACGTAPVVSDIPAFREMLGEAAMYFDPYSVEGIGDALGSLLCSEENRRHIVDQAPGQVERFRLEPIAARIKQVLCEN
jgi:glycosyltransferase involved in cell wall biosynthesis